MFKREKTEKFLMDEFEWKPEDVVDSQDLAKRDEIQPALIAMAKSLTDGDYCRRARNFTDFSLPSQTALLHRDIDISIIYEFCILKLGLRGQEMRDNLDAYRARKRKCDSSDSDSRPRKR